RRSRVGDRAGGSCRRPSGRQEGGRGGRRSVDGRRAREHRAGGRGDLAAALPRPGPDARPGREPRRRLRETLRRAHTVSILRIAVPNNAGLAEPAADMLREAGYRQRADGKDLVLLDADNNVEFFFLRPRDIAVYVGSGTLDVGITGRDLLLDSAADAEE